jgi:hypothetical protein
MYAAFEPSDKFVCDKFVHEHISLAKWSAAAGQRAGQQLVQKTVTMGAVSLCKALLRITRLLAASLR